MTEFAGNSEVQNNPQALENTKPDLNLVGMSINSGDQRSSSRTPSESARTGTDHSSGRLPLPGLILNLHGDGQPSDASHKEKGDKAKKIPHAPRLDNFDNHAKVDHFRQISDVPNLSASGRPSIAKDTAEDKKTKESDQPGKKGKESNVSELISDMWGVNQDLHAINDPAHSGDRNELIKSLQNAKDNAKAFTSKDTAFGKATYDFLKAVQGHENADSLMEKQKAFIDAAARHSTIVDLRTYGDPNLKPEIRKINDAEMDAERETCHKLGVHYENFSMNSKQFQEPERLNSIVSAVNSDLEIGNKVDVHCFHGTDRTGLVIQSVRAATEAAQNKDHKLTDPQQKYNELSKELLKFGCDPATHREVFHSLDSYLHALNGEKTPPGQPFDNKNPTPLSAADAAQLQKSESAFKTTFDHELAKNLPPKMFVQNVIEDYKTVLSKDMTVEDPKTQTEYYRELSDYFDELWIAAKK